MTWLSLSTLFGCQSVDKTFTNGPFTIERIIKKESSGSWYNNGTSPFARDEAVYYQVRYKGKKVKLQEGASNKDLFYKALFLTGTAKPAVLVGSAAMYILTEENDELKSQLLNYTKGETGYYQWLDEKNHQPGNSYKTYGYVTGEETGNLAGGSFLLINNCLVLNTKTLEHYFFEKNSYEAHQKSGDFFSENEAAVGFSPGSTQIAFVGYKRDLDNHLKNHYGLVVADFMNKSIYAVPFDQNVTRFIPEYSKQSWWLSQHFEWSKDAMGREQIIQRKADSAVNWRGYFNADVFLVAQEDDYYALQPVKPSMTGAFRDYLIKEWGAIPGKASEFEGSTASEFKIKGADMHLFGNIAKEKRISLSPALTSNTPENRKLLREIGSRFNKLLAEGKFREHFDEFE